MDLSDAIQCSIAALTAAAVTFFEMDRSVPVPRAFRSWTLRFWWYGYVLSGGVFAALLYLLVRDRPTLTEVPEQMRGFAVGLGYLALLRVTFVTYHQDGKTTRVGLDKLYESVRGFFIRRVEEIARPKILEATDQKAEESLGTLTDEAQRQIRTDSTLTEQQVDELLQRIRRISSGKALPERDKKREIAYYLVTGRFMHPRKGIRTGG